MSDLTTLILLLLIALTVALITKLTQRPYTIALVIWGLILGLLQIVEPVHLTKELVLTVFLPPLLFEGALHIKAKRLRAWAGLTLGLAFVGPLVTTLAVGAAAHLLLGFDWLTGLLLGAIITPTDPVSVLATFRNSRVDPQLATIVEGESLFNDGFAVVLYIILIEALGGAPLQPLQSIGYFLLVVGGGAALGAVAAMLANWLLKRLDDHLVEVMLTLIVAYGAFLLAEHFHLSGVIAVSVAGLVVGNRGLGTHRTSQARKRVVLSWGVMTFLVNSILFLLIGFELKTGRLADDLLAALVVAIVILGVRALLVYGVGAIAGRRRHLPLSWQHVIWWGGLRGGVPIALALGLPLTVPGREQLVGIIFGVVLLSLLGQGLTIPTLIRRLGLAGEPLPGVGQSVPGSGDDASTAGQMAAEGDGPVSALG